MTEKLTEDDIKRLGDFNLFRVDNLTYEPMAFAGTLFVLLSFFVPYFGWKRRPATPPQDIHEFWVRLMPYLLLGLALVLPLIANRAVKWIELRDGTKRVIAGEVISRTVLPLRRKLLVFKPLKMVIYRRGFNLMELKAGDKVLMELTYLGRLLNFKKME